MSVELFRIDDRLIHGQVVVGWARPLRIEFIALVDDAVAASEWEQELYRMGVPAGVEVYFDSLENAVRRLPQYLNDPRRGIVLTGDVATMRELADRTKLVPRVNIGGLHHRAGRSERLAYVFLAPQDEEQLRALAQAGVEISAQDVPATNPVALRDVLEGNGRP